MYKNEQQMIVNEIDFHLSWSKFNLQFQICDLLKKKKNELNFDLGVGAQFIQLIPNI